MARLVPLGFIFRWNCNFFSATNTGNVWVWQLFCGMRRIIVHNIHTHMRHLSILVQHLWGYFWQGRYIVIKRRQLLCPCPSYVILKHLSYIITKTWYVSRLSGKSLAPSIAFIPPVSWATFALVTFHSLVCQDAKLTFRRRSDGFAFTASLILS